MFKDYFSKQSTNYATYRPYYPCELFEILAAKSPARELAWDCGTGNGQAALGLAELFDRVLATDASQSQIENAKRSEGSEKAKRIEYRVAKAESSPLESETVDLITVAQALHWFEIDTFFAEARRVLKPEGIIAVWCYTLVEISVEIDAVINSFYFDTVGNYWPAERGMVEDGYKSINFPFLTLDLPTIYMKAEWNLEQLLGYIRTWSAVGNYINDRGNDPVLQLQHQLELLWGEGLCQVRWPLHMRVGRKTSSRL